jgi:hypothetical protein
VPLRSVLEGSCHHCRPPPQPVVIQEHHWEDVIRVVDGEHTERASPPHVWACRSREVDDTVLEEAQ